MYARVTTLQFYPEKMEEGVQIAREMAVPDIQQQQGLKSFVALKDDSTGKAMLITLFETEAEARAGLSSGFVSQQAAKIATHLVQAPTVEFYEVAFQG
jgi:hypothetical protein